MRWDFFIAHAGRDTAIADDLFERLDPHALVFLDSKRLLLGDDWALELRRAQRESLITVVLISEYTEAAYYQREEIAAAIQMARQDSEAHRVVPVYLNPQAAEDERVPYGLRLKHGLFLAGPGELERAAEQLLALVDRLQEKGPVAGVPEKEPAAAQPPKAAQDPPPVLRLEYPLEMEFLLVPAGHFQMGSDRRADREAFSDEFPQRKLELPAFYIARFPVTNGQYEAFIRAARHSAPPHWQRERMPAGLERHPIVNVSWEDATAFCKWLAEEALQPLRLPTEAEWEKAARGADGRIYPWGNTWDSALLNSVEAGPDATTPVGAYSPGSDSPYGLADMAGNVWEWCGMEEEESGSRPVRGGSFRENKRRVRCAARGKLGAGERSGSTGFRVGFLFR